MTNSDVFERLGLKEDKPVIITSEPDFDGNGITVVLQGNEIDSKTEQTVNAANLLIEKAFGQTRDEIDDNGLGEYQALIPNIDHIGALIRSNLPYTYIEINLELVKEYIDWFMRDNLHKSAEFEGILA
jgi:hypothetical protein